MKDKHLEQQLQQSLQSTLSGLRTTSRQRELFYVNATGGNKVKRKLTYGLILALLLILMLAVTSVAFALTRGFGILDFAASNRQNVEVLEAVADDFLHDLKTVDCGHATVVFREAAYDGMTCHLVYDVIPKEKEMLLFNGIADESWYGLTHLEWPFADPPADDRTILDRWQEGGYTSAWEVDFDLSSVDGADYYDVYGGMGCVLDEETGIFTGTMEIPFDSFKAERSLSLYVRLLPLRNIYEEFSYDYDRAEIATLEYTFQAKDMAKQLMSKSAPISLSTLGITVNEIIVTVLPQELGYQITYAITDPAVFHAVFDHVGDDRVLTEFPCFRFVIQDLKSGAYAILPEGITHEFSQLTIDEDIRLYVQRGTLGRSELRNTYTLAVFKNLYSKPLQPLKTFSIEMQP